MVYWDFNMPKPSILEYEPTGCDVDSFPGSDDSEGSLLELLLFFRPGHYDVLYQVVPNAQPEGEKE